MSGVSPNLRLLQELLRALSEFEALDSLLEAGDASLAQASQPKSSSSSSSSSAAPPLLGAPTNERLHAQLNRVMDSLARIEGAATATSTSAAPGGSLEPSLLAFMEDAELSDPDCWLQQRLGELVVDEKLRLLRAAGMEAIARQLRDADVGDAAPPQ